MSFPAGPDVVAVYVQESTTDAYGNVVLVPSATPVNVRGHVQPATTEEQSALGQPVAEIMRFLSRSFPANAYGKCVWDGREWDILGAPRRHYRGHHYTTRLRAREA